MIAALTMPTVHLNGTSGEVLRARYEIAARSIDEAIAAVCDTGPNARDYYVQSVDAALCAQREHEARLKALRAVRDELVAIWNHLDDQIVARDEARRTR